MILCDILYFSNKTSVDTAGSSARIVWEKIENGWVRNRQLLTSKGGERSSKASKTLPVSYSRLNIFSDHNVSGYCVSDFEWTILQYSIQYSTLTVQEMLRSLCSQHFSPPPFGKKIVVWIEFD